MNNVDVGYGMTETIGATLTPIDNVKNGSVGTVLPSVECEVNN